MKKVTKPSVSYGNSYLDKQKSAPKKQESKVDHESNGVMKKFINLDDIPDIGSNPVASRAPIINSSYGGYREGDSSYNSDDQYSQNYPVYRQPQPSSFNSGNNLTISTNGNKLGNRDNSDDLEYYVKASPTKFGAPLQLSPKRPASGSNLNSARSNNGHSNAAPLLPYELKQMNEAPKLKSPARNNNSNAGFNSKFNQQYDDPPMYPDDDDDDWNNMTPPHSPHKPVVFNAKVNSIVPVKASKGNAGVTGGGGGGGSGASAAAPPPLPHEVNRDNNKAMTEEEKLYYSRQPRQVSNFKPYSLKEYTINKPKGYVMIESLKPDLNTEELIAKRNNAERIKQFSKNLSNYNKEILTQAKKLPSSSEKHDIEISRLKHESKTQRAKEFSKNIPKPVVRSAHQQSQLPQLQQRWDGDEGGGGFQEYDGYDEYKEQLPGARGRKNQAYGDTAASGGGGVSGGFYSQDDLAEMKLQQLTAKHNQSRQQVDSIRRAMGL